MADQTPFEKHLKGKNLIAIEHDEDFIRFITSRGEVYELSHTQDCCESVYIEDICGDLDDLLVYPLEEVEEVVSREEPEDMKEKDYRDSSETWTFYKLRTHKGAVTIRWYGSSNGYYSESVDFHIINRGIYA
jgi:hypothetical protein